MPRVRTRQQAVIDKIKGAIAEELFVQLHTDIGCLAFRSGTEFLYPNLYQISKLKKDLFREKGMDKHIDTAANVIASMKIDDECDDEKDYEDREKERIEKAQKLATDGKFRRSILNDHFYSKPVDNEIFSTPDFTILTPTGLTAQIEVKYRANGVLSKEEQEKYLRHHPNAIIFVFIDEEPYINVYVPKNVKRAHLCVSKEIAAARARLSKLTRSKHLGENIDAEEERLLKNKIANALYDTKREYDEGFLSLNQQIINAWRAGGGPDDQIEISVELPDFDSDARFATINALIYPLSTLKRYAEILKVVKGPLDELYKKESREAQKE